MRLTRLKELLSYNPCTGYFYWRIPKQGRQLGRPAGAVDKDGYRKIRVDYTLYHAGRLAWFYVYGKWPNEIDHIDNDPTNNRIWNLANGTHKDNMSNPLTRKRLAKPKRRYQWQPQQTVMTR
jgi:HNH endonuclease